MIPVIGSKWRHHNGIEYCVYDITNEHADPERREQYPITVSYKGANGKHWSKPLDNFLEKMTPIDDEKPVIKFNPQKIETGFCEHKNYETVLPKYHVTFDKDFMPDFPGLYFYFAFDAEGVDREVVASVFVENMLKAMPIDYIDRLAKATPNIRWQRNTSADRRRLLDAKVNYVGFYSGQHIMSSLWHTNGAHIHALIVLASTLKNLLAEMTANDQVFRSNEMLLEWINGTFNTIVRFFESIYYDEHFFSGFIAEGKFVIKIRGDKVNPGYPDFYTIVIDPMQGCTVTMDEGLKHLLSSIYDLNELLGK